MNIKILKKNNVPTPANNTAYPFIDKDDNLLKVKKSDGTIISFVDQNNIIATTATSDDILTGRTAVLNGVLTTGTLENKGTVTITPSTSDSQYTKGVYNLITVKGDARLISENIKKGITIFGIPGSYEGQSFDFSAASENLSSKLLTGYSAYNKQGRLEPGSMVQLNQQLGVFENITDLSSQNKFYVQNNGYVPTDAYVIINGLENLNSSNIRKNITILGVTGSLEEGTDFDFSAATSDFSAFLAVGQKAYNEYGILEEGTMEILPNKLATFNAISELDGTNKNKKWLDSSSGYVSADGYVEINGLSEVKPENIKKDVVIAGVIGTFEGKNSNNSAEIDTTISSDLAATTNDILFGKSAFVNGVKVDGSIRTYQDSYNINSNGILNTAGKYLTNNISINIAAQQINYTNITAENVKYNVNIPLNGITGTFTSDGNISSSHVLKDKIAYSKGEKIVGTMTNHGTVNVTLSSSRQTLSSGYYDSINIPASSGEGTVVSSQNYYKCSEIDYGLDFPAYKNLNVTGITTNPNANGEYKLVDLIANKTDRVWENDYYIIGLDKNTHNWVLNTKENSLTTTNCLAKMNAMDDNIQEGSGTKEDPYNWYGILDTNYPQNTVSMIINTGNKQNERRGPSALIKVYLDQNETYLVEQHSNNDSYLYILDENFNILRGEDGSVGGLKHDFGYKGHHASISFKPNYTGIYYIDVNDYNGNVLDGKVAITPAPIPSYISTPYGVPLWENTNSSDNINISTIDVAPVQGDGQITWSGYKAIKNDGFWEYENIKTNNLNINGFVPQQNLIYSEDTKMKIASLYQNEAILLPKNNLVFYAPLNGNNKDLISNTDASAAQNVTFTTFKGINCAKFDSDYSYIRYNNLTQLNNALKNNKNLTIVAFVAKIGNTESEYNSIASATYYNDQYGNRQNFDLYINNNNNKICSVDSNTYTDIKVPQNTEQWFTVALVKDSYNKAFTYINGKFAGTCDNGSKTELFENLNIGWENYFNGYPVYCYIAHFAIYNSLLGENQIANINNTLQHFVDKEIVIKDDFNVDYVPPAPDLEDLDTPLTFTARTNDSQVYLNKYGNVDTTGIQYRLSTQGNWKTYKFSEKQGTKISLKANEIVQFRNKNQTLGTSHDNYFKFKLSGELNCSGNLTSMIYYQSNVPDFAFYCLFHSCKALFTAPEIKVTSLGNYSLGELFYNCSNLTSITTTMTNWGSNLNTSTQRWVNGVLENGTFTCPTSLQYVYQSIDRIPLGWNVQLMNNNIAGDYISGDAIVYDKLKVYNGGVNAANDIYEVIGYNTQYKTNFWSNGTYNICYFDGYWVITSQETNDNFQPTTAEYYSNSIDLINGIVTVQPYEVTTWNVGTAGISPIPTIQLYTMQPLGSGTKEDPYNWYGEGFLDTNYPQNTVSMVINTDKEHVSRDYEGYELPSALIKVYLDQNKTYLIEQQSERDSYLYILDKNFSILRQEDGSAAGLNYDFGYDNTVSHPASIRFKPNYTGIHYVEATSYDSIEDCKVAITPAPLISINGGNSNSSSSSFNSSNNNSSNESTDLIINNSDEPYVNGIYTLVSGNANDTTGYWENSNGYRIFYDTTWIIHNAGSTNNSIVPPYGAFAYKQNTNDPVTGTYTLGSAGFGNSPIVNWFTQINSSSSLISSSSLNSSSNSQNNNSSTNNIPGYKLVSNNMFETNEGRNYMDSGDTYNTKPVYKWQDSYLILLRNNESDYLWVIFSQSDYNKLLNGDLTEYQIINDGWFDTTSNAIYNTVVNPDQCQWSTLDSISPIYYDSSSSSTIINSSSSSIENVVSSSSSNDIKYEYKVIGAGSEIANGNYYNSGITYEDEMGQTPVYTNGTCAMRYVGMANCWQIFSDMNYTTQLYCLQQMLQPTQGQWITINGQEEPPIVIPYNIDPDKVLVFGIKSIQYSGAADFWFTLINPYYAVSNDDTGTSREWENNDQGLVLYWSNNTWILANAMIPEDIFATTDSNPFTSTNWEHITECISAKITFYNFQF